MPTFMVYISEKSVLIQAMKRILVASIDIVLASSKLNARQLGPETPSLTPVGPYIFTGGIPGCTNGPDNSFSFTWEFNTSRNAPICGVGWDTGTNRTISFKGSYVADGVSMLLIYGWTREPPIEYLVVESWGYLNPASAAIRKGTVTCDDALYDVLEGWRVNQTAVDGDTQYIKQNWSLRRSRRSGTGITASVDMNCHFNAWTSVGMELGTHDYQLVSAMGYSSKGKATLEIVT
ncbi:hypothetical protein CVT24_012907 [Panaeolus cyanescens]|uniref:Endo-1,4-beta-xylanase n=1 Tax=Panaeolus cyanescens TaxID=181874 RepID=A0A409W2Q1_9AGAR|nr:hypothetical protein CVT24_012907 [Panaeolus cyanescens]